MSKEIVKCSHCGFESTSADDFDTIKDNDGVPYVLCATCYYLKLDVEDALDYYNEALDEVDSASKMVNIVLNQFNKRKDSNK